MPPMSRGSSQDAPVRTESEQIQRNHDHIIRMSRYEGVNPFCEQTNWQTWYEVTKLVFMTILFVPVIRFILVVLTLSIIYVMCLIMTCFLPKDSYNKPHSCMRKMWLYPIRFGCRVILFICGFYWISVKKDYDPKNLPRILVPNHTSMYDHFYIMYRTGASVAAKAELFDVPLIGTILRATQSIPVERHTAMGREQALRDIAERGRSYDLPPLLVFPQGTTTNLKVLTTYKRGSFASGLPVQPIVLEYPAKHCDLVWGIFFYFFFQ